MRLIPKDIEVTDDEGFTPEKDIFERKEFGERLTQLFERIEHPLVAILDAPWGMGKTTFTKMWAGHLRNLGFPVVYFDAFQNDYLDDPFVAISGEVFSLYRDKVPQEVERQDFKENAIKVGKAVFRSGAKVGIKVLTLGVLDGDDYEDAAKEISKELASLTDRYIEDRLEKHEESKSDYKNFRISLERIGKEIAEATRLDGSSLKPLIFIVDELDRCRPMFSLELLEKIKHFFSVEGVHFVLVTNLQQLEQAVNNTYGGQEGHLYLQKFAHAVIKLPEDVSTKRYVKYLFDNLNIATQQRESVAHLLTTIADIKKFSLRQIERICVNILLIYATAPGGKLPLVETLTGLCILKVGEPSLYARLVSEQNKASPKLREQIREYFQIVDWPEADSGFRDIFSNMLDYCFPHVKLGDKFASEIERERRNSGMPNREKVLRRFISIMEATKLIELPPDSPKQ